MRVMVMEDHPAVMGAVCSYLEQQGHEVVARSGSTRDALSLARGVDADVVVMVVVLGNADTPRVLGSTKLGHDLPPLALADHEPVVHTRRLPPADEAGTTAQACSTAGPPGSRNDVLSAREREVVALIAAGFSTKEVAKRLCVSIGTAKTHRLRIFRKLRIHTVAELTRYALENGIATENAPTRRPPPARDWWA